MKKWIFCLILILAFCVVVSGHVAHARQNLSADVINGGGTDPWAMDRYVTGGDSQDDDCAGDAGCNYAALSDGDWCDVYDYVNQRVLHYAYDADSAQTEDGLNYIAPDYTEAVGTPTAYTGDGRWVLAFVEQREKAATAFSNGDTTPDVSGGRYFKTANTGATTISDFDAGSGTLVNGHVIWVEIADSNTTVDFSASGLKGHGGIDWEPSTGDIMAARYNGTDWLCTVSYPSTLSVASIQDTVPIVDDGDNTKKFQLQASGITTGQTRTLTVQDSDQTLVGRATTDTLTNKTINADGTGNTISNIDQTEMKATLDLSGKTLTLPSRSSNEDHHYIFNLWGPNGLYSDDTQICIDPKTDAAITITSIEVTCDADPTTELNVNLKFADAFIGLANATLIVACDTTNGTASITSGWNDNTVPSGKCIYLEWDAQPDANITQVSWKIKWDYD